jgi:hypothetical protein
MYGLRITVYDSSAETARPIGVEYPYTLDASSVDFVENPYGA